MSDNTEYPPPTNPYPDEPPRLSIVPKPTINGMILQQLDDTGLELAHTSNRFFSLNTQLITAMASAKVVMWVIAVSLLLNTLLLVGLLVAVSFLYGAMR